MESPAADGDGAGASPPPPTRTDTTTKPAPGGGCGSTSSSSEPVVCTSAGGFPLGLSPTCLHVCVLRFPPLASSGMSPSISHSVESSIISSSSEGSLLEDPVGLFSSCTACTSAMNVALSMVTLSVFWRLFPPFVHHWLGVLVHRLGGLPYRFGCRLRFACSLLQGGL